MLYRYGSCFWDVSDPTWARAVSSQSLWVRSLKGLGFCGKQSLRDCIEQHITIYLLDKGEGSGSHIVFKKRTIKNWGVGSSLKIKKGLWRRNYSRTKAHWAGWLQLHGRSSPPRQQCRFTQNKHKDHPLETWRFQQWWRAGFYLLVVSNSKSLAPLCIRTFEEGNS